MLDKLLARCAANISDFRSEGECFDTPDGVMIYKDNGANVLAVAHLDNVMFTEPKLTHFKRDAIINCPQLDDRLGTWVILDVLPSIGLHYDVLLTDSEEIGRSTASYFKSPKQYNWIFEFDRRGTDVVMYQYETRKACTRLRKAGFEVGYGSFSDISCLEGLGVQGFNFGVGYHCEHSKACFARLSDTVKQVDKFGKFFDKWQNVKMPWQPSRRSSVLLSGNYWQGDDFRQSPYDDVVIGDWLEETSSRCLTSLEYAEADSLAMRFGYGGFYEFLQREGVIDEVAAYSELRNMFADCYDDCFSSYSDH
jgi:hypothetical protein